MKIFKQKACAVILRNKKFLVVRNVGRNIWTSPGGHIEKGETPEQAVRRELKEEFNLTPSEVKLLKVIEEASPIEKDTVMKLYFFLTPSAAEPKSVDSEIEETMWVDSRYKGEKGELIDSLKGLLTPELLKMGLIS